MRRPSRFLFAASLFVPAAGVLLFACSSSGPSIWTGPASPSDIGGDDGGSSMGSFTGGNTTDDGGDVSLQSDAAPLPNSGVFGSFTSYSATLSTSTFGEYLALADVDGDKILDAVISAPGAVLLRRGTGNGAFAAAYATTTPAVVQTARVRVADFNGDGKDDLLLLPQSNTLSVLLSVGDGTFKEKPISLPAVYAGEEVGTGDFDGDGHLDLVDFEPDGLHVYPGNGDGTFRDTGHGTAVKSNGFTTLVTADLDKDGHLDAIVGTGQLNVSFSASGGEAVFLGRGDGGFVLGDVLAPVYFAASITARDITGDGYPDVASCSGQQCKFWPNSGATDGGALFPATSSVPAIINTPNAVPENPTSASLTSAALFDYVAAYSSSEVPQQNGFVTAVMNQAALGTYGAPYFVAGPSGVLDFLVADVNGDHLADLLVLHDGTNKDLVLSVALNTGTSP